MSVFSPLALTQTLPFLPLAQGDIDYEVARRGEPDLFHGELWFMQGGAHLQFAAIPMNLMKNGVADYIVTGQWAKKAYQEAQKYGKVNKIASSEDKTFS